MHPRPEFHVLCVGLQGVGKSSLLAVLAGERESLEEVQPTQGMNFSFYTVFCFALFIIHTTSIPNSKHSLNY